MNLLEIPDLLQLAFEKNGWEGFNIIKVEPSEFLNNQGFKMTFELSSEGLVNGGLAYGTIIDKKLYLMVYVAALIEFYSKGVDDFIQMAKSAEL